MPTALRVNPTRMEMTRIKKRLVTATRGHKLLKDKRDEMVRQFILLIRENYTLRREVEAELSGALRDFAMARAVMSPQSLEAAVLYPARQAELHVSERNILSVHVPTIEADQASLETTVQSYGFAETSAELDGSIATLASVLPKLVRLAEIEKTCDMLADEIEKAREIIDNLKFHFHCQYDEKDSIGKRYRRQDAIGTPYCVTVDHQTLEDNCVTLRNRDTMEQERVAISELNNIIADRVSITSLLKTIQ